MSLFEDCCYWFVLVDTGVTVILVHTLRDKLERSGGKLIAVTRSEVGKVDSGLRLKSTRLWRGRRCMPPLAQKEPSGTFQHMAQFRQQMETVCESQQ